ncbi:MAG TPA: lysophospholipid acyltransferase family protein [Thermoanaerobaculia bacterium]
MLRARWIAVPLSALVWTSYVLIVILWTPLVLLVRLLTFPFDRDRRLIGRFFHLSAVLAGTITPFWTFRIEGAGAVDRRAAHVFVANHSSYTDVFLVVRLPWEMKWLSKRSIFSIPLLGWQLRIAGDVPIVRGDRDSARDAMAKMRRILERGVSVILFPEGTRSPDGRLGEFRDGAFRLAIESGVDVVPLAISGAAASLPKRSLVFHPATATLRVLPAVATKGLSPDDARTLGSRVRSRIVEAIGAGGSQP